MSYLLVRVPLRRDNIPFVEKWARAKTFHEKFWVKKAENRLSVRYQSRYDEFGLVFITPQDYKHEYATREYSRMHIEATKSLAIVDSLANFELQFDPASKCVFVLIEETDPAPDLDDEALDDRLAQFRDYIRKECRGETYKNLLFSRQVHIVVRSRC